MTNGENLTYERYLEAWIDKHINMEKPVVESKPDGPGDECDPED